MNSILVKILETVLRGIYGAQVAKDVKEAVTVAENSVLEGKFKKEFVINSLGDTAQRLTVLGLNALVEIAALWITAKLGKSIFKQTRDK